jgi:hypothetical protein
MRTVSQFRLKNAKLIRNCSETKVSEQLLLYPACLLADFYFVPDGFVQINIPAQVFLEFAAF